MTVPLTLPDLLREGLAVVFVGINPSIYSAERGHYFARPGNRFWPCLSQSDLGRPIREALAVTTLGPEHDRLLPDHGIGFTDLVKRATVKASDLSARELAGGVEALVAKLRRHRPRVACFHGITGYRHVHEALAGSGAAPALGLQPLGLAGTHLFLAPNPSGANAHFTRADQVRCYDELARLIRSMK